MENGSQSGFRFFACTKGIVPIECIIFYSISILTHNHLISKVCVATTQIYPII